MNWRGGRWNLYGSFTDGFTDGYKINYYFNLFRRWSVKNPSVIFEFRTKIFNDPPNFSWSVGNFISQMTRSEMHLMHHPLEFAQSVGNFVGKIDPPTTYRRTYIRRYWRRDCGILSNYFQTLYEMPTDLYSLVLTSVIVAFQVIIFELSVKCRRTYSVSIDICDCGISSNYFWTLCEMPTDLFRRYGCRWLWHFK
jgi:hypothetical protein